MTKEEIIKRVGEIVAIMHDAEFAHVKEDELRADFISSIAEGDTDDIKDKAQIVLSTGDLDFPRWCA